ncbi:kinase-like protein [Amniculicola lignicola CBS 123094]|uniref:non-specific serine/threonine protein kinase n=1 Tax=Amniculicola lignicola CBS 123094 TaxID=1392246 RepID=A0A6A5WJB1_9PLEO|nr:kinase-like protein [Amniculicola lignicola CBS 123094]
MDERERQRSMSLVPYIPADSREVVLRHGSAVVVFDQQSKQLSLRDASHSTEVEVTSCPYCHRPWHEAPPHKPEEESDHEHGAFQEAANVGFVNPGYFQMLRGSQPASGENSRPASPHKQLAPPPMSGLRQGEGLRAPAGAEFVESTPAVPKHHGISARAFSPNYFKTFFVVERELGRGGKGVVLLVNHMLDGVSLGQFACKRVPVGDDHEWLEKVLIEVQLLQNLSHQNLVSYRHVWLEDYQISNFGPSVPCAFILQQYCNGGDLHSHILQGATTTVTKEQMKERVRRRSRGQMEDPQDLHGPRRMHFEDIIAFFKDITSGLNHLHANGYIHRDLKPSNCLIHNDGRKLRVLVSDFGEVQSANSKRNSTGATGTISYCAPEVLKHEVPGGPLGNFTTKSDIFSLGMIVYFMCFARLPYVNADGIDEDNEDLEQLRTEISAWVGFNDDRRVRSDLPEKLYQSLKHLLALNPDERPGTEEILKALKSPSVLDEFTGFSGPSGIDEFGPRISRADTPSPAPVQAARKKSSSQYTRPGRSKLGATAVGDSTSPPPPSARDASPAKGKVILHPHKTKVDLPIPSPERLPSPQRSPRLMLPPPPPPRPRNRIDLLLHNPTFIGISKMVLFGAKVYSLFAPCQPYAAHPWVMYPMLFLASADFLLVGITWRGRHFGLGGLGGSVVLLGIHVAVVVDTEMDGRWGFDWRWWVVGGYINSILERCLGTG